MRKFLSYVSFASLFGFASSAIAAVPQAIDDMTTDATTVWGDVQTLVLAVVGFFILLGIVQLVRRRR